MDKLERKILQLEVEATALVKEEDAISQHRAQVRFDCCCKVVVVVRLVVVVVAAAAYSRATKAADNLCRRRYARSSQS